MNRIVATLFALAVGIPVAAFAQQKTLYVARVAANASLKAELAGDERAHQLTRIIESLDEHLITEIVASRKYRMLERSDALEALVREQSLTESGLIAGNGAQMNGMTGADYALFVTVDAFQQTTDVAVFNGIHRAKVRCQLSAQLRVVDATTAEILEASAVQLEKSDIADVANLSNRHLGRFDALLPALTREMAEKSTRFLVSATFPPTVIDVDENYITINAGKGVFSLGDTCRIYGRSRTVTDPDTGIVRKIKGRPVGTVTITEVEADYAQGEVDGTARVTVGAQVKPVTEVGK